MRCAILVLDDPWETSHGGTQRTQSFLGALTSLGHDVACVYSTADRGAVRTTKGGVEAVPVLAPPLGERDMPEFVKRAKRSLLPLPTVSAARNAAFVNALQSLAAPEVLIVQQLRTAQYHSALPGASLWFDQVDLWSSFAESEKAIRHGLPKLTTELQRRSFLKKERHYAASAGIVTAAGYGDAAILGRAAGRDVRWLPNPAFIPKVDPSKSSHRPRVAGLLGNFRYWPNRMAYDVLTSSWAPILQAMGWDVLVAGHGSEDLPPSEFVTVLGPQADPRDFYARIGLALAPIVTGGGIKVKVLEALFAGLPVAATPTALEGFPPDVRALSHTVQSDGAGWEGLDAYLDSWFPQTELLSVFDPGSFQVAVAECLEARR